MENDPKVGRFLIVQKACRMLQQKLICFAIRHAAKLFLQEAHLRFHEYPRHPRSNPQDIQLRTAAHRENLRIRYIYLKQYNKPRPKMLLETRPHPMYFLRQNLLPHVKPFLRKTSTKHLHHIWHCLGIPARKLHN